MTTHYTRCAASCPAPFPKYTLCLELQDALQHLTSLSVVPGLASRKIYLTSCIPLPVCRSSSDIDSSDQIHAWHRAHMDNPAQHLPPACMHAPTP